MVHTYVQYQNLQMFEKSWRMKLWIETSTFKYYVNLASYNAVTVHVSVLEICNVVQKVWVQKNGEKYFEGFDTSTVAFGENQISGRMFTPGYQTMDLPVNGTCSIECTLIISLLAEAQWYEIEITVKLIRTSKHNRI